MFRSYPIPTLKTLTARCGLTALILLTALLFCMAPLGFAKEQTNTAQRFASPEEAATALAKAVADKDRAALLNILGEEAEKLLGAPDDLATIKDQEMFTTAYQKRHAWTKVEDYQVLLVGPSRWPFPVPLVQDKEKSWHFDTVAGLDELALRRIGHNELAAIEVCQAYVDAQRDYYRLNPQRLAQPQYARYLVSTSDHKDGLYWETKNNKQASPLGALMAAADASKAVQGEKRPYYGYYYKILYGQGSHAAGGAWSYLEDGEMIGGFALLAYPADYGHSGVMSFMVNQSGVVYEKNLGPETEKLAEQIEDFDPDATWQSYRTQR